MGRHFRTCKPCNKRIFSDRIEALFILANNDYAHRRYAIQLEREECRAYECPAGNGYHLTSQESFSS